MRRSCLMHCELAHAVVLSIVYLIGCVCIILDRTMRSRHERPQDGASATILVCTLLPRLLAQVPAIFFSISQRCDAIALQSTVQKILTGNAWPAPAGSTSRSTCHSCCRTSAMATLTYSLNSTATRWRRPLPGAARWSCGRWRTC